MQEQKTCPLRVIANCALPEGEALTNVACLGEVCAWWCDDECAITQIAWALHRPEVDRELRIAARER